MYTHMKLSQDKYSFPPITTSCYEIKHELNIPKYLWLKLTLEKNMSQTTVVQIWKCTFCNQGNQTTKNNKLYKLKEKLSLTSITTHSLPHIDSPLV
jgi:hypothetical protein